MPERDDVVSPVVVAGPCVSVADPVGLDCRVVEKMLELPVRSSVMVSIRRKASMRVDICVPASLEK